MRMELTDEVVAELQPRKQRYDATAAGYPGFGVRVHPSGTKTWFYRYRMKNVVRMMRLGRTSCWNHQAALTAYIRARNARLKGLDPQGILSHPVTEEAFYVLFDIHFAIRENGLSEVLGETPSLEEFAAHFRVSVAAIKKLSAHGYLALLEREEGVVVVPLWYAIRRAVDSGDVGLC